MVKEIVDYFTIEGNGFDVGGYEILDLIDQLDEPEVLSQEWIDEHSKGPSRSQYVWVDDLKTYCRVAGRQSIKTGTVEEAVADLVGH